MIWVGDADIKKWSGSAKNIVMPPQAGTPWAHQTGSNVGKGLTLFAIQSDIAGLSYKRIGAGTINEASRCQQ
ncbi:hypothetical protein O9993_08925 [Vibrio lentus]|nr:hypothetical protein [Vibrio lentus]